ncbi:hypothetical protein FACS1894110_24230 [Spirochaetia bacterium]|nr:hypothetical protein FACS1894110_24230 [Spirochaetia bacterium]
MFFRRTGFKILVLLFLLISCKNNRKIDNIAKETTENLNQEINSISEEIIMEPKEVFIGNWRVEKFDWMYYIFKEDGTFERETFEVKEDGTRYYINDDSGPHGRKEYGSWNFILENEEDSELYPIFEYTVLNEDGSKKYYDWYSCRIDDNNHILFVTVDGRDQYLIRKK